ncbi:hypothetical protein HVIM_04222 [Roseomonas mucosa]|nr:hypothetical protein HVIM_04222 [Roseomonas mucosa]QDD99057.1 hypothetical protein ADP8_04222 [Roseomonas mucosa]UZO91250.1 hypothetical protein RMP42_04222 [Roseomonas mucosa]
MALRRAAGAASVDKVSFFFSGAPPLHLFPGINPQTAAMPSGDRNAGKTDSTALPGLL